MVQTSYLHLANLNMLQKFTQGLHDSTAADYLL